MSNIIKRDYIQLILLIPFLRLIFNWANLIVDKRKCMHFGKKNGFGGELCCILCSFRDKSIENWARKEIGICFFGRAKHIC